MRPLVLFVLLALSAAVTADNPEEHSLRVHGVERWTTVYVPANYRRGAP